MSTENVNGCRNCGSAQWQRTPKMRIKKSKPGKCLHEIVLPPLPISVDLVHGVRISKGAIWADRNEACPLWKPVPFGVIV